MAKKKGGKSKYEKADDLSIESSEKLWRLIHPDSFVRDWHTKNLDLQALRSAFSGSQVSALRPSLLEGDKISHVQRVMPGLGIGELSLGEIRKPNDSDHRCIINIEEDKDWPKGSHVIIYKYPGKPRLTEIQKAVLAELLAKAILLEPDASKVPS